MGLSSKQVSNDMNNWNNQDLLESATTTTTTTLELPKTPTKIQLNCPRCDSTNTKFCYYNNYNKSQPRHFCKACKRHWTKGGTLRNVPVGGGRKNKRFKPSKPVSKTTTTNTNLTLLQPQESTLRGGSSSFQEKTFSETFYQTFLKQQQQQQHTSLPQSSITFTSNNNEGFYLDSTIKTTSLGLSSQHVQHDEIVEFPNNNYSNLEYSTITSIQTPNNNHLYNFTSDHNPHNHHHHHHHPWNMHASSSSSTRNNNNDHSNNNNNEVMDMMSSSWGWDDFDKFVSVEPDLTIPWDDDVDNHIKP